MRGAMPRATYASALSGLALPPLVLTLTTLIRLALALAGVRAALPVIAALPTLRAAALLRILRLIRHTILRSVRAAECRRLTDRVSKAWARWYAFDGYRIPVGGAERPTKSSATHTRNALFSLPNKFCLTRRTRQ